jgi:hypothetical protein
MIPAATPQEAMFVIERKLLTARARCERIRYFPYPGPDRRLVIACAELADGSDIQVLARLDFPIAMAGDDYDEAAIGRAFQMPSRSVH